MESRHFSGSFAGLEIQYRQDIERARDAMNLDRDVERRRGEVEVAEWVDAYFPMGERWNAMASAMLLRRIHGKGRVTVAMVKRRMQTSGLNNDRETP